MNPQGLDWVDNPTISENCAQRDDELAERVGHGAVLRQLRAVCGDAHEETHLLDLGCGTGKAAVRCAESFPFVHITAVDISPHLIEIAQREYQHDRVQYRRVFAGEQPLASDEAVDAVMANFIFPGMKNPDTASRTLAYAAWHLKPGGVFLMLSPGEPDGREFTGFRRGNPGETYSEGEPYPMHVLQQDGSWDVLDNYYWSDETQRLWLAHAVGCSRDAVEIMRAPISAFYSTEELQRFRGAENTTPPFTVFTAYKPLA